MDGLELLVFLSGEKHSWIEIVVLLEKSMEDGWELYGSIGLVFWSGFVFLEKTMDDGLELYGSIGFVFLGKSMDGGFACSRRGKLDCGKPSAHRCQSQDNSRPKEKYCMANESGAHMARAEDFIFDEYVTHDKMWPQTPQCEGFLFARLADHV